MKKEVNKTKESAAAQVRVSAAIHYRLSVYAAKAKKSRSQVAAAAVEEYLRKHEA